MPGFLSKAMDYLGLSDNDAYGEYEPYEDQAPPPVSRRQPERQTYDFDQPTVRAVPVVPVSVTWPVMVLAPLTLSIVPPPTPPVPDASRSIGLPTEPAPCNCSVPPLMIVTVPLPLPKALTD